MRHALFKLGASLAFFGMASPTSAQIRTRVDPRTVTVSGVSSGGFMAIQLGVAHSSLFRGMASIAGGIYGCAEGSSATGQNQCMGNPSAIDSRKFVQMARQQEANGTIDSLAYLQLNRAYVFSSKTDYIIRPEGSTKLVEFLTQFMPPNQIAIDIQDKIPHGLPTLDQGNPCNQMGSPWINACNYDLAGRILNAFYGPLNGRGSAVPTNLQRFDQRPFQTAESKLYDWGTIYIPTACKQGATCRLHLALHGCQQNADFIQDKFPNFAGFNEWAESNHIVILYPQSAKSNGNPYGCWDWFGFSGADYVNKKGPQIQAVRLMVESLIGTTRNVRR